MSIGSHHPSTLDRVEYNSLSLSGVSTPPLSVRRILCHQLERLVNAAHLDVFGNSVKHADWDFGFAESEYEVNFGMAPQNEGL